MRDQEVVRQIFQLSDLPCLRGVAEGEQDGSVPMRRQGSLHLVQDGIAVGRGEEKQVERGAEHEDARSFGWHAPARRFQCLIPDLRLHEVCPDPLGRLDHHAVHLRVQLDEGHPPDMVGDVQPGDPSQALHDELVARVLQRHEYDAPALSKPVRGQDLSNERLSRPTRAGDHPGRAGRPALHEDFPHPAFFDGDSFHELFPPAGEGRPFPRHAVVLDCPVGLSIPTEVMKW